MKGLSKEERLEKRIAELERLIYKKDNDFDKEQGERVKRTFLVLSGVIYLIAFMLGAMQGDIKNYLGWLVLAPIVAGATMFISFWILFYIMNGALNRAETIAKLKAELDAIKYFDSRYK